MGRRETLARAIKLKQQKTAPPAVIVISPYALPPGSLPVAVYALNRRKPTEAEFMAAFMAAGYPEFVAKAAAAKIIAGDHKKSHPSPARIQPAADKEQ